MAKQDVAGLGMAGPGEERNTARQGDVPGVIARTTIQSALSGVREVHAGFYDHLKVVNGFAVLREFVA